MANIYPLLERVAECDSTVLVTGESGTGKELVARALHARSHRAREPFVALNCAAMPEQLLESELFGHVRGAFTDAKSARPGLLLQAGSGTIFLDEIGDMPAALQPKLLRTVEERKLRPVGGNEEVPFDARIIAATNRDLESMVEDGRFREDLYYRINVITIGLPPLRARGDDVLLLAQHFIERFANTVGRPVVGLSDDVARLFRKYPWPGNVRELRNSIERAVALTRFDQISVTDLPERVRDYTPPSVGPTSTQDMATLEEMERRYILHVLRSVDGNKSVASERLGLSRKTLYRKLALYGVPLNELAEGKTR
jgi:transcriptional regulator with PAS, ATPase and Fis domain